MRVIVVTIFALVAAMIVMAPHTPSQSPPITKAAVVASNSATSPTQDCMNAVAGADGSDAPTQDCLGTM